MRSPTLIALLVGALVPLTLAQEALKVRIRQTRTKENGRLSTVQIEHGGEKLSFAVPRNWSASLREEESAIFVTPRSSESPVIVQLSSRNARQALVRSEDIRRAVLPDRPEAKVLEEFPAHSGYSAGRGVDFLFPLFGSDMKARAVIIPLSTGYVSFVITRPVEDFERARRALSGILTSFHRATNSALSETLVMDAGFPNDRGPQVKVIDKSVATAMVIPNLPLPPEYAPRIEPPPYRSIFEGRQDYVRLFLVCVLGTVLAIRILGRHKLEAEIRALRGGYLSDGTEVASFQMPALFVSQAEYEHQNANSEESQTPDFYVGTEETAPVTTQADEFFAKAPEYLAALRKALQELGRAGNEKDWAKALAELPQHVTMLKDKANFWDVRPAWQLSCALELLVKRIVEKPKDATPSTLRSVSAAVDLLHSLCVPGIRPNLVLDPPIAILAADDDALCLRAISFALQKASLTADTAANGVEALALAAKKAYDVILMDIQMPEMDGLTAAGKLQETSFNADTPVVFVTIQSDFLTRAQSTQSTALGGGDLMAKPFLVFELAVKTLTFVMRKRLRSMAPASNTVKPMLPAPAPAARSIAPSSTPTTAMPNAGMSAVPATTQTDSVKAAIRPTASSHEFFLEASALLATTRKLLEGLSEAADDHERLTRLANARMQIVVLITKAIAHHLHITPRIGSSLEALLKRLHKNPRAVNPSTLNTVTSALKLLERLCLPGMERKLADQPARILVVDDEPLSRRAMVGALQLAFEKPESADDGTAALTLVDHRHYDVIFTDIQMPGLDGFGLCKEIRAGTTNPLTPVVFITSHTDEESRQKAIQSGGTDFICKPFLPIEISVKALTLTWEGRLKEIAEREDKMAMSALEAAHGPDTAKAQRDQPQGLLAA
jgi:CheY-like chemotaxis protein